MVSNLKVHQQTFSIPSIKRNTMYLMKDWMCKFSSPAVTNTTGLGGLNYRNLFSQNSGD